MGNHLRLSSVLLAAAAFAGQHAAAQAPPAGQPIVPAAQDPAIAAALRQVSAERIEASIARLVSFNNRSTLSSMDSGLPAGTGATAAADWLFAEFSRISADCGQCLEVKRDDFIEPGSSAPNSRIPKDTRLQNIYAVLKGTDPAQANRYVLVTGHYDSRNSDVMDTRDPAPGANDDASGVAVSLECARVLSKLKFPSTIVFVAADGEEQGLNGSRHLAKLARAEKWDLEAALDDDIVGGDKTPGQDTSAVRLFSEGVPNPATLDQLHTIQTYGYESDSPSREVARAIAEVDRTYFAPLPNFPPHAGHGPVPVLLNADFAGFHPVLEFRRDRFGRGGDHTSFNAEGFAAVRFTEWQENFNHQHQTPRTEAGEQPDGSRGPVEFGDFLKFVDFNYVAKVARLNAAALATFAAAPGEPLDVRIPGGSSDNFSILSWKAPAGAPAGTTYEVVWRATAEPQWTHVASAGSALTLKLAVSKDDVVFGVRSVDAAGHRSPAVVPMPASRQTMSPSTPRRPQN